MTAAEVSSQPAEPVPHVTMGSGVHPTRAYTALSTSLSPSFSPSLSLPPRARFGRIKPTPQVAVAVTEIAQDFGDLRHLAANCTQAMRVWETSGRSESRFVGALYEARAITKQQPRVANRMPYFWSVVRDLLALLDEPKTRSQVGIEGQSGA